MKQWMKIAVAAGILAVWIAGSASAQTVLKIGYVDFQKIIESWPEAKQKMDALEAEYAQVQEQLNQMDDEIQKWKEDLEAKRSFMTKEKEAEAEAEYQQKVKAYLGTFNDKRSALEEKKKMTLEEVRLKVKSVVQDVAERHGYSLVMRKQDLVYAAEKLDITNEVITELGNKR